MSLNASVSTPVTHTNLNNAFAFDAQVVSGAAEVGDIYATLTAALAAGKKSIIVHPGTYTDDITVSGSNVTIIGAGQADWGGAAYTGGVHFSFDAGEQFNVGAGAKNVVVKNISVETTDQDGFNIQGDDVTLINCQACGCLGGGSSGISCTGDRLRIIGGEFNNNGDYGISVTGDDIFIWGVRSGNNGDDGISQSGTAARIIIIASQCFSNTDDGISTVNTSVRAVVFGCICFSGTQWGVDMSLDSGANEDATRLIVASQVHDNGGGEISIGGGVSAGNIIT